MGDEEMPDAIQGFSQPLQTEAAEPPPPPLLHPIFLKNILNHKSRQGVEFSWLQQIQPLVGCRDQSPPPPESLQP